MTAMRSLVLFLSLATLSLAQLNLEGALIALNLNSNILISGKALVGANALTEIIMPSDCAANQVVGLNIAISAPTVSPSCTCMDSSNDIFVLGQNACPQCPVNSVAICGAGNCGCACTDAYFATALHTCALRSSCPDKIDGSSNLVENTNGTALCSLETPDLNSAVPIPTPSNTTAVEKEAKIVEAALSCDIGYIRSGTGSCVLQASAAARARRSIPYRHQHKMMCSNSAETACSLRDGGFECLNLTKSLESCGGCPGKGGVTCVDIPGVMDVVCEQSKCLVSSCYPGWSYVRGTCVRI